MDHSTIAGVVAAAGLSSRMNAFKPLLRHGGTTIIESTVESLLASGAEQVFVVVGHQGRSIEALFRGHPRVRCVENPRYADGDMFASVRIGLSCAAAYDKVLFLPGDMPAVEPAVCRAL